MTAELLRVLVVAGLVVVAVVVAVAAARSTPEFPDDDGERM